MLYPSPSRSVGIIDALKSFLSTVDSSVDPETINNLPVEEVQKKVLTAISNKTISAHVITQFSNLFYGANSPLAKAQGNKVLERIKDQNIKENFKQAKIRFLITKALCSKLIKDAQARAAKEAYEKKMAKARLRKKAGSILALGKYWEELAEYDRISEEKLLALIKKQHQEAMAQLRGLQEAFNLLKGQLREIDRQERQILEFYSKEIAADLKGIQFKDGTSPFENVSNEEMEEIAEEYIKRDYEASKKIEDLRQEIDEIMEQKTAIEQQIKEDTQSSPMPTSFEKRKNDNNMGELAPPPAMLPFKKHKEHIRKSESAHPLSEKLKALTSSLAQKEAILHAQSSGKDNLLLKIVKEHNLKEVAELIESHDAEFKEIIHQKIEHNTEEACDELNICYAARAEIIDQIKEVREAGRNILKEQRENLDIGFSEAAEITGKIEKRLETFNALSQELDEFNFDDDEELELTSEAKAEEKTRPRL